MKVLKSLLIVSIFLIAIRSSAQNGVGEESTTFALIDADKNKILTIREMINFYDAQTDENGQLINAKKLFYGLDANKNSIITLNEYMQGVNWKLANEFADKWDADLKNKVEDAEKENHLNILMEKFTEIDSDFNEELNLSEVMRFYEGKVSMTTGNPIDGKLNFYAYDTDENGNISLEEFLKKPNWKAAREHLESDKMNVQIEEELVIEEDINLEDNVTLSEIDSVPEDHLNKLIAMFNEADVDGSFKLTMAEFSEFYKNKKDVNGNPINAELNFYGLDKNDDGSLNLLEFTTKIDWEAASKKYSLQKKE